VNISKNRYVVLDITVGGNPSLEVEGQAETNYDMVYYEYEGGVDIVYMDEVVVGISQASGGNPYYEVFNWGDNVPDTHTNVDVSAPHPADPSGIPDDATCTTDPPECDNRIIPTGELYDPDPAASGPQTGILIDVDNAPSNPPTGYYDFVVIISPTDGDDAIQVDAIELVEEPSPP